MASVPPVKGLHGKARLTLAPIALAQTNTSGSADLILRGGEIITVNDRQPHAEALAIRNGVILAVGDDKAGRNGLRIDVVSYPDVADADRAMASLYVAPTYRNRFRISFPPSSRCPPTTGVTGIASRCSGRNGAATSLPPAGRWRGG